jgi:hypothetical protein
LTATLGEKGITSVSYQLAEVILLYRDIYASYSRKGYCIYPSSYESVFNPLEATVVDECGPLGVSFLHCSSHILEVGARSLDSHSKTEGSFTLGVRPGGLDNCAHKKCYTSFELE